MTTADASPRPSESLPGTDSPGDPRTPDARPGRRRFLPWSLAIALTVIAIGWSLHFPFSAERLYRAVPDDASIIGEHQSLGSRWPQLAANPVVLAAAGATNAAGVSGPGGLLDSRTCTLVRMFAPRCTVSAYVPAMGLEAQPAWMVASYAGSRAQLLRWLLSLGFNGGMTTIRSDGVVTWIQDDPSREAGRYLSVGITDGILVACVSGTREAAAIVLRRMEARAPLAEVLQDRLDRPDESVPDRIWLRWRERVNRSVVQRNVEVRLDAFTSSALSGTLKGTFAEDGSIIGGSAARAASPWEFPKRLLPDRTVAAALLEPAGSRPFSFLCADTTISVKIVASALDRMSSPQPAAFAALFHGDLGGRLLGLKVPSIVLGIRARPGVNVEAETQRALDALNAANRWALLPRQVTLASGRTMTIVDSSSQDLIASLAERERPAIAMHDDWILLSSCASTLDALLDGINPPGFERDVRWARPIDKDSAAAFWLDTAAIEPAVRHGLAVYELAVRVSDPRKAAKTTEELEPIRRWTSALGAFRTIGLTVTRQGDAVSGRFDAGPSQ